MSICQHCGQGAIAKDANGPVCPDCWDEGYYETANHMTDKPEAPERIWVETRTCTVDASGASRLLAMDREFSRGTEFTRADLSDAKDKRIVELEDKNKQLCQDFNSGSRARSKQKTRIDELEAALSDTADALDLANSLLRQKPVSYPIPLTNQFNARHAAAERGRATLAELKGTDQ